MLHHKVPLDGGITAGAIKPGHGQISAANRAFADGFVHFCLPLLSDLNKMMAFIH